MNGRLRSGPVVGLLVAGLLAVLVPSGPVTGGATPLGVPAAAPDLDGDGLAEIGVFAIETRGQARGPWFQLYRANGSLVTGFFLEPGLTDFQIRRMNLDADPLDEVAILAVDAVGNPVLEVRDGDGTSLGRQQVAETGVVEPTLFELEADGAAPAEIGVGYSTPQPAGDGTDPPVNPDVPPLGPGLFEVWSLGTGDGLVMEGGAEVIPDGFSNPEWRVLDVDDDGAQEILAGYTLAPTEPGPDEPDEPAEAPAPVDPGSGAIFRVVEPAGALVGETMAGGDDVDGAQWVVGDFLPARTGDEVMVGLKRKGNGPAVGRLFDATGSGQLRGLQATPPGVSELSWGSIAGPLPAPEDEDAPPPTGPASRQVFVGFRLETGVLDYRVWNWPDEGGTLRVGGGTILGSGVEVNDWLTADFDGNALNGGEVVVVFTRKGSRSIHFQHWSRAGLSQLGAGRLFDSTFIEVRAAAIEAVVAGRQDLLVTARPVGEAPEIGLWNVNGPPRLLLDQKVLNRDVQ